MDAIPKTKRILVLYWHPGPGSLRIAISRHLHVLDWSPAAHRVLYFNAVNGVPNWVRHFRWDVVVFHTTFLCLRWSHLFHKWKWHIRWLNEVNCLKVAFPQDEYDHAHILDEWLFELGVHLIFTNFDETYRRTLYPLMYERAIFRQCLTGYIDETDAHDIQGSLRDQDPRPMDIVYRASHLPYWFGSHGQLKHRIAEQVLVAAGSHGLRVDISTKSEDTIVGPAWLKFLRSGRTVIGCESGSSVLDRRGAIKAKIQQVMLANPDVTLEQIASFLPADWDGYRFFAVSPRHLEAVMTRTCQVLIEGAYDGILHPHIHYLPLRRDWSDLAEVLERIKNRALIRELSLRAYRDICESGRYTYRRFADEIEDAMQSAADHQGVRVGGSFTTWARIAWPATCRIARASEVGRLARYRMAMTIVTSPFYWCFLRHPLVCMAKAQLALRLIASSPRVRRLVKIVAGDKSLREKLRLRDLLLDCFMLRILQQLNDGRVKGLGKVHLTVDWQEAKGEVIFKSQSIDKLTEQDRAILRCPLGTWAEQIGPPDRIVWDHSAIGREVLYPVFRSKRITLPIGDNGIYRFRTLPLLARQYRGELVGALAPGM
ncbi:MAG: hypothetical protein NW701_15990 [Nitrospira sp.]